MAEVSLKAGAKIDVLNRKEMKEVLDVATRDWFNQVARGDRYRRFSASAAIDTGSLTIGGAAARDAVLGPAEGFVWAVQRIGIYGLTIDGETEPVQLFVNDDGPSSIVHPAVTGYQDFGSYALVLYPGDVLLVKGTDLVSEGTATVTGQVREVPYPLAWRLGG
ncbi:hypothetical protein ACIRD9_42590 [Streptomyces violaceus]|uniref:hypothetical protein n=1 Tax=Streptomyces violaceus TaxID=1936 RepID=UPI00382A1EF4